jgi:uncharacterized protein (DUF1919 family)
MEGRRFCLISDDCWGGALYQHLARPYNTPFIGLQIHVPDFLQLIEDLPGHLDLPLRFGEREMQDDGVEFPVGFLGGVKIHFIHYRDEEEAEEKWIRRRERIEPENLFFKLNAGRKACTSGDVKRFFSLPGRKLAISRERVPGCVAVPRWDPNAYVLFWRSQRVFNAVEWLTSGAE